MSYRRSREDKNRLEKLYKETGKIWWSGAYYDKDKNRYIRIYSCDNRAGNGRYLKKRSNKKVRKSKNSFNYCQYKKLFDYWYYLI